MDGQPIMNILDYVAKPLMLIRMTKQLSKDVLFDCKDAILNEGFEGFKEDYLCLHSLIRRYRPSSFFEIGTCAGVGTLIICNAVYRYNFGAKIYSLELPPQESYKSEQYDGGPIGEHCFLPYNQIRHDSLTFDYSEVPCEGYFVDGEHTMEHVLHETKQIIKCNPKLIVWHDTDMPGVMNGILIALDKSDYNLYRITDTRISYATNT